jgi:radical S-adenosyl methionine domain-containing protein 2
MFQVLPVTGQNSTSVEPLLISLEDFQEYVARHRAALEGSGIPLVPESNSEMRSSYAMLDARGRFFTNALGSHSYGPSIFDSGMEAAWSHVGNYFKADVFASRGGLYDWGQSPAERQQQGVWVEQAMACKKA